MAISKPPVVPIWSDTAADPADITKPADAFIQAGWPLSSSPPARQYFNWVLKFCANAVRYFSRRGIIDYDNSETYQQGDIVRGDDGLIRQSLQNNNTNRTPS